MNLKRIRPVCADCKSKRIIACPSGIWSVEEQRWLMDNIAFNYICYECGVDVLIKWEEVDD